MASDAQKVVATAGLVSVGIGTVNSIGKNKTLPSTQFLLGSGVLFLILSAMAEGQPELAKSLSLAVMTTVILGEGGGVLTYLNGKGEIDTQKKPQAADVYRADHPQSTAHDYAQSAKPQPIAAHTAAYPGLPPQVAPFNPSNN